MRDFFYLKLIKPSLIFAFFSLSFLGLGQNSEFEGYKKLGIHASGMLYRAAQIEKKSGDYEFSNNPTISGRIGFDYVFNHTKELTFRTGLYLDLIPYFNADITIKKEDLPVEYADYPLEDNYKENKHLTLTIPFLVELKKPLSDKLFFNVNAGLEITLLRHGGFEGNVWYSNDDLNETRQVFSAYGDTNENWMFYPSAKISPGIYFVFDKVLYQVNFTYKKSLMSYFKGEYQFGNLEVSEPTRGEYKMTGDYIGLGLTVFFKKSNSK